MPADSAPEADPDDATEVGSHPRAPRIVPDDARSIAGYELLDVLGRGGAGTVYRARHLALGKVVALKLLDGGSESDVARFVQEARAMASLDHPNIVRVHDVGESRGRWFIVMDLVTGGTLSFVIREAKTVALARALELTEKVARAVAHAHERGIVHRDLKPSNVLLDAGGEPLVADFGLARRLDAGTGITASGEVLGTPAYMAPEQIHGERVDERADVYALGVILFELLSGETPIPMTGVVTRDLLIAATAEPPSPRRRIPSLPAEAETILLRCLAPDRRARYESALALALDLARLRRGEPIEARPPSFASRAARWAQRRRAAIAIAVLALAASALSLTLLGERLAERRSWEEVARFRGTLEGWVPLSGAWTCEGGELRGRGRPARLALAASVAGDVRVEYTARLVPTSKESGDLSVELLPSGSTDEDSGYFFGFGTEGNSFSKLARLGRRVAVADGPAARVVPERDHRVRVEREGPSLRLSVDGTSVLEHRDLVPLDLRAGARVVLYTWDADARFSRVVVSRRSPERRPPRSEVADGLLERGEPAAAALLYAEAESEPGLTAAERSELALKRGLAEVAAASESPPSPERLARADDAFERVRREAPGTDLALEAELGAAEGLVLRGELDTALGRIRAAARSPLAGARDSVRELLARSEASLARRGRHEPRIALLHESASLFQGERHVDFESRVAEAESLVELGRAREAEAVLEAAIERLSADDFFSYQLLLEVAAVRVREGNTSEAREALALCAARAHGAEQTIRVRVERALVELDAGGDPALASARELVARVPSHAAVVSLLEAVASVGSASGEERTRLLGVLDAAARRGAAPAATEEARVFGAHAALAAATNRLSHGEAAGAELAAATESRGALLLPGATLLLVAALVHEHERDTAAARHALERVASGFERAPHLAAVARALAAGSVPRDGAARLLADCGDCGRDRALGNLELGGFALLRGDTPLGRELLASVANDGPAPLRAVARWLLG